MYIEVTYNVTSSCDFELPSGRTWEDVKHYYVKWDVLYVEFTDETRVAIPLMLVSEDTDMKRPYAIRVHTNCGGEVSND